MNAKHITIAAALLAAPTLAVVAQPSSASTISLTDSWTVGTATHLTGSLPTLSTASQSTSNLGFVSPLSNPKTQSLALGVATSGEVLFVAVPNGFGTNAADIPITFTLSDGIGSVTFTDYINYYANFGTDTDDFGLDHQSCIIAGVFVVGPVFGTDRNALGRCNGPSYAAL